MKKYRGELIWNREFNWYHWYEDDYLDIVKASLINIRDSGDGARVKSIRIVDADTDEAIWQNGYDVKKKETVKE